MNLDTVEGGLPETVETEKILLGSILLSADTYSSAILNGLTPDDMSLDSHHHILTHMAIMGEAGRHIDLITLAGELRQHKQLDAIGGVAYLSSLTEGMPVRRSVQTYVRMVREKAKLRKLIQAFDSGITAAMNGSSAQQCIDSIGDLLLQIQTDSDEAPAERVIKFSDAVYNDWERIADSDAELIGLSTGIESLDLTTTGIRPGELWFIAGRAGDGKSSLALQVATASLQRDISIGFFSLEMSKAEILQRLWAQHGGIPFQAIRNPRGIDHAMRMRIKRAMGEVGCWPLFVQDGLLTIQRLLARARLLIRQEKVKLLIVDYLQIVHANAQNDRERATRVSNALRELAKSEGVPVLAISQLNRPKDRNLNERPNKFSLKESGSLENDAHTILLTYRPVDEADQPSGEDLIIVAKQRHGPVSLEPVYFDSRSLVFRERIKIASKEIHARTCTDRGRSCA